MTARPTIINANCLVALRGIPARIRARSRHRPAIRALQRVTRTDRDRAGGVGAGDREATPSGRGFGGKSWDAFVPPPAVWDECLRVLKPGGHLLAFAGARTFDLMGLSIRLAGFEIRDSVAWLYGSGFPKGQVDDEGRGPNLKPAFEPVVLGRKPFTGSLKANIAKYGTGALNIDEARIPTTDKLGGGHTTNGGQMPHVWRRPWMDDADAVEAAAARSRAAVARSEELGRYPANVILDEDQATALDEQTAAERAASRFFYVAKPPKAERPVVDGVSHPTIKPVTLMRYLVKLVTPPGGVILDPFAGSGTTVEAALDEGFEVIAIEREPSYIPLIDVRIGRAGGDA